jgi:hypothetical protein
MKMSSETPKPLFEIKIRSRETKHEARIELRDGSSFVCEYKVLAVPERGEPRRKITELVIVTDKGRFDVHEITGLPKDFPIFIAEDEKRCIVRSENISEELRVGEPVSVIEIATILHEIGHYAQYEDVSFSENMVLGEDQEVLDGITRAIRKKRGISFAAQLGDVRRVLEHLPLKNIRPRFRKKFLVFVSRLDEIDTLSDEIEEQAILLADKIHDLLDEKETAKENGTYEMSKERFDRLDKEMEERENEIFNQPLIKELLFFVSEPERILERDATRRALTWLKEIGEKASLPSFAELEKEEGGEFLFEALSTYSFGCVSIEKNK